MTTLYYVTQGGSRILDTNRNDLSGSDGADVTNYVKTAPFILAVRFGSNKDTQAAQYRLNFRVYNTGNFGAVASTGKIKFGATDLVNEASIATGSLKCSTMGYTAVAGREVEGTANSLSINLGASEETEVHVSLSAADGDDGVQYEFELYDVTAGTTRGTCGANITLKAASVALTANNITSGATVLGTPTAGVKHNLAADGITTGTTVLGTPTAGAISNLTADGILSQSTVLGTPDIGQEHVLTAAGILTQTPVLGTPTCAEQGGDACVADNILAGTPILGTPDIGQEHVLTADNIATQTTVLGTPVIGQEHVLYATGGSAGPPVLGAPTAAVIHNLLAANIVAGIPVVDSSVIGQLHVLTAVSLDTGNPILGTPDISEINILTADGILAGYPITGTPTAGIAHNLVATGIVAGEAMSDIIKTPDGDVMKRLTNTMYLRL